MVCSLRYQVHWRFQKDEMAGVISRTLLFSVPASRNSILNWILKFNFELNFETQSSPQKNQSLKTTFSMQLQWKSRYWNLEVKWCSNCSNCFIIFMVPVFYIQVLVIYFYACSFLSSLMCYHYYFALHMNAGVS